MSIKGPFAIHCLNSSKESCDCAKDIAYVLRKAGWDVAGPTGVDVWGNKGGGPPAGIEVGVSPCAHWPEREERETRGGIILLVARRSDELSEPICAMDA
jgi:hypothetical protein